MAHIKWIDQSQCNTSIDFHKTSLDIDMSDAVHVQDKPQAQILANISLHPNLALCRKSSFVVEADVSMAAMMQRKMDYQIQSVIEFEVRASQERATVKKNMPYPQEGDTSSQIVVCRLVYMSDCLITEKIGGTQSRKSHLLLKTKFR